MQGGLQIKLFSILVKFKRENIFIGGNKICSVLSWLLTLDYHYVNLHWCPPLWLLCWVAETNNHFHYSFSLS